jgi:hypothetical protein
MNAQFVAIVERMCNEHGKSILLDAAKSQSLLNDYAQNEYERERHLLLRAIEAGVAREIAHAADLADCRKAQARVLQDEHFINETAANEVIDLLALVLRDAHVLPPQKTSPAMVDYGGSVGEAMGGGSGTGADWNPYAVSQTASQASLDSQSSLADFIDPTRLTSWVRGFLVLYIGITIISLITGTLEYQLLQDAREGEISLAQAEASDARQRVVAILTLCIYVVLAVLVLKWIYRANFNARQLGAAGMQFTPGWSIGWYFIPIVWLWKPYQAMKEIWKASANPQSQDWQNQEASPLLGWWWFLWIVSGMIGYFIFKKSMSGSENIDDLIMISEAGLFSSCVDIALDIALLVIVNRIYAMQMSQYRRVS